MENKSLPFCRKFVYVFLSRSFNIFLYYFFFYFFLLLHYIMIVCKVLFPPGLYFHCLSEFVLVTDLHLKDVNLVNVSRNERYLTILSDFNRHCLPIPIACFTIRISWSINPYIAELECLPTYIVIFVTESLEITFFQCLM